MRIKRDGTGRQIILNREKSGETSAGTWVSGRSYLNLYLNFFFYTICYFLFYFRNCY